MPRPIGRRGLLLLYSSCEFSSRGMGPLRRKGGVSDRHGRPLRATRSYDLGIELFRKRPDDAGAKPGFWLGKDTVRFPNPLIVDGFLDRVFEATDGILNLASGLLRIAFGFELGIAGYFAHDFFGVAFGLLDGALDSILVHIVLSLRGLANVTVTIERLRSF